MKTPMYKEELLNLIKTQPRSWQNVLKSKYRYIFDDILANIDPMFNDGTISAKVHAYLNDIHEYPKCAICGKTIEDITCKGPIVGFRKTCDNKECANKYKYQQTAAANRKKYGVDNVYSLKSIIDKSRHTKLDRYGSETYNNSDKNRKTCMDRYGVDNAAQVENVKDKIKQTCMDRYGVEYSFQAENVKDKIKQTCMDRYGVENGGCSQQALDKISNTLYEHFGVTTVGQTLQFSNIKEKAIRKSIEKYGVDWPTKSKTVKATAEKTCIEKYGCRNYSVYVAYQKMCKNDKSIPCFTLAELDSYDNYDNLKFKCLKCGNEFIAKHADGIHRHCPICYPYSVNSGTSNMEHELLNFVKSIAKDHIIIDRDRNAIRPYEIDILDATNSIGFEFNGLFWHSDANSFRFDPGYHVMKSNLCESKDIQLIHIFENEWVFRRDVVESEIKKLFNLYNVVVSATDCEIKQLSNSDVVSFYNENCLQSFVDSKVNIGLLHNGILISVMSFSKICLSNNDEWKITQFCTKKNFCVEDDASTLLSYFEQKYKPTFIVSNVDRRWSNGKLYYDLGFSLDSITPPNCWYFRFSKSIILEPRSKYQKHKLESLLEKYDPSLTELENMHNNKYYRIFDSGNLIFVKTYHK